MKRSRALRLSIMGTAPLAFSACSRSEPLVFPTLSDCLADLRVSPRQCTDAYDAAHASHLSSAPRFGTNASCEAQYGASGCEYNGQYSASLPWLPRMSGFVVGQRVHRWYGRDYIDNSVVWYPQPLYRTHDDWGSGTWSTSSGSRWGGSTSSSGSSWGSSSSGKTTISTSTLSRGGFGGTSSARSSWGG